MIWTRKTKLFRAFQPATTTSHDRLRPNAFFACPRAMGCDRQRACRISAASGTAGDSSDRCRVPGEIGAIAQLGERYNGIVEVSGSIPLSSTNFLIKRTAKKQSALGRFFVWETADRRHLCCGSCPVQATASPVDGAKIDCSWLISVALRMSPACCFNRSVTKRMAPR